MTQVLDQRDETFARDLETVARTKWNLLVSIADKEGSGNEAEDAVQIAFMMAWQKRHQWNKTEGLDDPVTFMVVMTHYGAMKLRPSHGKLPPIPMDFTTDYESDPPSPFISHDADPACRYEERASARGEAYRQRIVAEALSLLAPRERRIVELHYMHGMPYSTVAPEVSVGLGTARFNGRSAMKKIRRHFGEPESPPRPPAKTMDPEQITEYARTRAVEVVRLLQEERLSRQQVCDRMGVSANSIRAYLRVARALGLIAG